MTESGNDPSGSSMVTQRRSGSWNQDRTRRRVVGSGEILTWPWPRSRRLDPSVRRGRGTEQPSVTRRVLLSVCLTPRRLTRDKLKLFYWTKKFGVKGIDSHLSLPTECPDDIPTLLFLWLQKLQTLSEGFARESEEDVKVSSYRLPFNTWYIGKKGY